MAYSDSRVVVSGRTLLNKFRRLLERLSQDIEEDELDRMKFLLQGVISSRNLEECSKARELFQKMVKQGLLGEDNLDNLAKLLTDVRRLDLVKRVRAYQQSELPGNVIALDFLYFYLSWLIFDIITSRIYIYIYITDWKKLRRKLTALTVWRLRKILQYVCIPTGWITPLVTKVKSYRM